MKQRTKEEVTQVLMDMLYETPLETLRVKDLCERAGISKSSFYRMFQDKYEAANWIYKRIADEVVYDNLDLSRHGEWGVAMAEYMLQHKALFRNIVSYHGQNSFQEFLSEYNYKNTLCCLECSAIQPSEEQKFALQAYCILAAHEYTRWALTGFQMNYEKMVTRLHLCIPECVKSFFKTP